MKKFNCMLLFAVMNIAAFAQKNTPVIKPGTSINYTFNLHGQQSGFELIVKTLSDTVALNWRIRGLAGGTYIITPAAFKSADKLNFAQPIPNVKVVLPPDQTFCMISKKAFNDLVKNHRYVYDNTTYDLKDDLNQNLVMPGAQQLDVLHVVARDETTEMWILNNPDFPLICKIKGNPLGIDITLNSIK
jgi:hypothetical protein